MFNFLDVDLYPVTGRSHFEGKTDAEVIADLAEGGAKIVQLREKSLSDLAMYELAKKYREETARHRMALIINDRVDIAQSVRADGVHLGQGDLPVYVARRILGEDAIIGASAHSVEQAIEAQEAGATYVNIGPLYATPTKPDAKTIGLDPVRGAIGEVDIPVTVMGGITLDNLDETLETGVRHVGVVSALFGVNDIASITKKFVDRVKMSKSR